MTTCLLVPNDTGIHVTVPNTYDERPWEYVLDLGDVEILTSSRFHTPTGTTPGVGRHIVTSTKPLDHQALKMTRLTSGTVCSAEVGLRFP